MILHKFQRPRDRRKSNRCWYINDSHPHKSSWKHTFGDLKKKNREVCVCRNICSVRFYVNLRCSWIWWSLISILPVIINNPFTHSPALEYKEIQSDTCLAIHKHFLTLFSMGVIHYGNGGVWCAVSGFMTHSR